MIWIPLALLAIAGLRFGFRALARSARREQADREEAQFEERLARERKSGWR